MKTGETPNVGTMSVDPRWKIVIVRSVWYDELTMQLVSDARTALVAAGVKPENIHVIDAPGSYELPLLCQHALENGADGCIAFGIIVQGDTHHARLVAEQSAAGCMQVQLQTGKPITFEVLFVDNVEHARVRSTGKGSKGPLAAKTLLSSLARVKDLR